MAEDLGTWLRRQRQASGWAVPEMARQLRIAATAAGDRLPGNRALLTMIRRWESGGAGVSERYRLHFCRAFDIKPEQFGQAALQQVPISPVTPSITACATYTPVPTPKPPRMPNPPENGMPTATTVPYREIYESDSGCSWIEREVLMAAHEGSEHAEQAERREIGDATMEQLRADVIRLSGESMTAEPLPLFMEMRRVRNRTHTVLDRRVWPRDQAEVCFLLGCLNALMANSANDLGYPAAAGELARAGWAYAVAIGHRSLMGHLRWVLANVADWSGQPRHAQDLAAGGLEYLPAGPTAALLHLKQGRAAARLGDANAARVSIAAAAHAAEDDHENELTQIGGEFTLSRASQHYLAGSVLVEIPGAERDAAAELDHASLLYSAGPAPGEAHGFGMEALARINLAIAQLRAGALDTAANAAQPVLTLPPGKRIATLPQCFGRVRAELAQPLYRGSLQARQFDEQIETFCRETVVPSLPANPG